MGEREYPDNDEHRAYMRAYMRRYRTAETPEARERRLAHARVYQKARYAASLVALGLEPIPRGYRRQWAF